MKRCLLVIFALFPFLSSAQARVGLRAGMNLASIRFQDYHPPKRLLPRLNAGIVANIPFDEKWSFNSSLQYAGKGLIYARTPSTGRIDSFTIRLNYIEIPLTIAYSIQTRKTHSLALLAGPAIGYGFNGSIRIAHSNREPAIHLHRKETDQYKRIELGYELGVIYSTRDRYGIRFDYSASLLNIQRVEKEWNRVYSFSFYWYLPGNKIE